MVSSLCCFYCLVVKLCLTLATPWTVARQAPLFMGFLRQECWSGLPFPSPGDLPHPETEPTSPALVGRFFTAEPPGKCSPLWKYMCSQTHTYACTHARAHTHTHTHIYIYAWASLMAQMVKNLPAMQETWVRFLDWKDPLEKRMVTHSGIIVWRVSWTKEPHRLQSMGLQRVGHD